MNAKQMVRLIEPDQLERESSGAVSAYLELGSPFATINAVATGAQQGLMYCADQWLFILSKSGFGQLFASDDEGHVFRDFLHFVKRETHLPNYFHLYDVDEHLSEADFKGFNFRDRNRIQYIYEGKLRSLYTPSFGFELKSIADMTEDTLRAQSMSAWGDFWRNFTDFKDSGFGSVAVDSAGTVQAICYSASVDGLRAEVDVLTKEESRGKGLGKLVTSAFVNQCIERNLSAAWDCFEDNYASIALADSCGFKELGSYRFISLFDPDK